MVDMIYESKDLCLISMVESNDPNIISQKSRKRGMQHRDANGKINK